MAVSERFNHGLAGREAKTLYFDYVLVLASLEFYRPRWCRKFRNHGVMYTECEN
jgi:hypothetical protein